MKEWRPLLYSILSLLVVACASLGHPDGGEYDETPPKVISCYPAERSVGVQTRKARINFDEFIKLENASEKVIVSPPQIEPANIRADGKHIRIELKDTLMPNTTYTIDFSDAIEDNNEGNPMGHYTYSFSTGDEIDTMEVSGFVLNAQALWAYTPLTRILQTAPSEPRPSVAFPAQTGLVSLPSRGLRECHTEPMRWMTRTETSSSARKARRSPSTH